LCGILSIYSVDKSATKIISHRCGNHNQYRQGDETAKRKRL
jgi:hypothetical protein